MLIKSLDALESFIAGDNTVIKEVLHPKDDSSVDSSYSLAYATLSAGETSYPHRLRSSTEVYVIVKGEGTVYIEKEIKKVAVGDIVFIPKNAKQYIENTGTTSLEFYCIVAPPWNKKDEVVYED